MSDSGGPPPFPGEPPAGMPGGSRRFRAGAPPREATSWGTTALLVALLLVATSWMTLRGVQGALAELKVGSVYTDALLVVLGIGWNFGFIGASALVLETHAPQEKNKVQAFNDFLIFGMMAIGSFSSGQLLANYGWSAVNLVVYPGVLLGLSGAWARWRRLLFESRNFLRFALVMGPAGTKMLGR